MAGPRESPEIAPSELARALEAGDGIQVLDVRRPAALATGTIDHFLPADRFWNVPGSQIIGRRSFGEDFVRPDQPVAVVCYHGNDSRVVAHYLNRLGYRAASLSGGMARWMRTIVPRELPPPAGFDRLVQLDRVGKGALGYCLVSAGEALLIDPPQDASDYLELAGRLGARVVGLADTHVHADYVSGGPSLALSLGAPYYIHPADAVSPFDGRPARFAFTPIEDGTVLRVGSGEVRVEHTPGHTEGSATYRTGEDVVFTGDFVFIGSVGRPDLGGKLEAWTPALWASLERARGRWPGSIRIMPAHYSSPAEREADRSVGRAFGDLPAGNEALRLDDAEAFAAWVAAHVGSVPEAYRTIKEINLGLVSAGPEELEVLESGKSACGLG